MTDQTLILLYGVPSWVSERELVEWVEHDNASVYRRTCSRVCIRAD